MKRACRTDSTEDCGNQPNALAPADKRSKLNDGAATDKPVNSTPAEELPQSSVAEQKPLHFATKESVQENAATATNEASNNEATTSSHVAKTDEPQDLKTSIKMEIKSEPEEHSVVPSTIAMKTEPIDEASSSSITATTLAVKTEPTDEEASTSTGAADASLLLPAPVAAVAPPPPPPTRVSCNYGIRCFRRNAQHRNQMAHPGDADYRRPGFPPAPPGAPACPYAGACYRRNPLHFVHFSHPADCKCHNLLRKLHAALINHRPN